MPFLGNRPAENYISYDVQHFTTSATTNYTLDHAVANENELRLVINNVVQQPGSSYAYSASGTSLTLTSATSATDTMYCVYLGKARSTVTPASGSVTNAMLSSGSFSNITGTGTLTSFASTGIDDNATSTSLTIASDGRTTLDAENEKALVVHHSDGSNVSIGMNNNATNSNAIAFESTDFLIKPGGTERVRVTNDGVTKISKNGVAFEAGAYHQILGSTSNSYELKILNKASSPASQYITEVSFANSSPDGSGAKFFQMRDSTTARVNINSDGDFQNHDNSYGSISDERIKQNIVDASSQWEDIKNIRVRKYKKKDDVLQYGEANAPLELGVISQELETVSPGLIKEDAPDSSHAQFHEDFTGENPQNVKYVKYSILYMKAIKALQEAMTRIEQLETKVQTLENN